ncbi:right-handed parallel beta-helix repeat-containing protein, partial [Candidatus Marinimicrobia bacterium]|nr:right-handed parallel beta-helix repeat-containing protein [Candidatus Neomarinimicrobiota bacterium]
MKKYFLNVRFDYKYLFFILIIPAILSLSFNNKRIAHKYLGNMAYVLLIDFLDIKAQLINSLYRKNTIKKLKVSMSNKNYAHLQTLRQLKFKSAILSEHAGPKNYKEYGRPFNAKINIDDSLFSKSKLKLFGYVTDHYRNPKKFSFRLKFNGGEKFGKKTVNLSNVGHAYYISDFFLNLIYSKTFNGLRINYEPYQVFFNKSNFGYYLMEDHLDSYTIESNGFRDNVIFKISSKKNNIYFNHNDLNFSKVSSSIEFLSKNNPEELCNMLDHDKTFGYISLLFLSNHFHAQYESNLKFYYNPVTNKIEPIINENDFKPIKNDTNLDDYILKNPYITHELLKRFITKYDTKTFLRELKLSVQRISENLPGAMNSKSFKTYTMSLYGYNDKFNSKLKTFKDNLGVLNAYLNEKLSNELFDIKEELVTIKNDTIINEDLVIHKNQKLLISPGTKIKMINNANIFIYGSLEIKGVKYSPVFISASSNSSSSIFIKSRNLIKIDHTFFKNLSSLSKGFWELPSAITFYETDNVSITDSKFSNNIFGDDFINFFRCDNIVLKNCTFDNIKADAVDSDFSNLNIISCTFLNIGNDAVDASGSDLKIYDSNFNLVEDKVISSGENSIIHLNNSVIENSEMGIVVKDGSSVFSNHNSLINNSLDLVM